MNSERRVVLQLLLYAARQRLCHGSIETVFRDWYASFRQAAPDAWGCDALNR
jgi:hypothetical protein